MSIHSQATATGQSAGQSGAPCLGSEQLGLAQVNKGPYEGGWLIKIKMSDPSELEGLLDSDAYKKQIE